MRIEFTSHARPERIAKALRGELLRLGHDIRYTRVREATAAMFGYASWNDLLGRAGKCAPDPSDQDAGEAVASARRETYATRLADELGIPREAAAAAVDAVGPTSRRGARGFDAEAAKRRIARYLSSSGEALRVEGETIVVPYRRWGKPAEMRYEVRPDGRVTGPDTGLLGGSLQAAGLSGDDDPEGQDVPETLRWLDARALRLLRGCPSFSAVVYEKVRKMGPDEPLARLFDEVPWLAMEIQVERDMRRMCNDTPHMREAIEYGRLIRLQVEFLASTDPFDAYLGLVADHVEREMPGLPFDRGAAAGAIRALGRFGVLAGEPPSRRHVAFLSQGPSKAWPRSREDAEAAIRFIGLRRDLFRPYSPVQPDGFFAEFDGDWVRYAAEADATDLAISEVYGEVAAAVIRAGADLVGCPISDLSLNGGHDVVGILAGRIAAHALRGKGFLSMVGHAGDWSEACGSEWRRSGERLLGKAAAFRAVLASGILAEGFADPDPLTVLERFGFDPRAYLDAVRQRGGAETSLAEIEARVSTGLAAGFPHVWNGGDLVGSRTFHEVEIGGVAFSGILDEKGPSLQAVTPEGMVRTVHLTSRSAAVYMANQDYEGWAVPGPGEPIGIRLDGASVSDVCREFGLGNPWTDKGSDGNTAFVGCPAFDGLQRYVETHPRIARMLACPGGNGHMPHWYDLVRARPNEEGVPRP